MKKRILLAITVLMVFGLAIAALAYTQANVAKKAAVSCCCCSGDSCPMKNKDGSADAKVSCCDKDNCCCKGDSCPMKNKDAAGSEKASCCCCSGDSCPLKKDGEVTHETMTDVKHEAAIGDSKTCCCSCCKDKKDTAI